MPSAARRDKMRAASLRWARANAAKMRVQKLLLRHSLRPEDENQIYEAQQGACYLCGDPLPADRARQHIDHDHRCCPPGYSCGYCRRGLGCSVCNQLVGLARDDPQRLRRIADNLEAAIADVTRRLAGKPVQAELFETDLRLLARAADHDNRREGGSL